MRTLGILALRVLALLAGLACFAALCGLLEWLASTGWGALAAVAGIGWFYRLLWKWTKEQ